MKLHVFLAICSQNKAAAISLAVLVSSVIGGGYYASTPNGQNAIRQIVETLPQTAAQAPVQEPVMTLASGVAAEAKIVIARETAAPLAAEQKTQYIPERFIKIYNMYPSIFIKEDGTLVFGTENIVVPATETTVPTTAQTAAPTTSQTAAQTAAPTAAQTAAPTTTQKTTQKT
ncbi:MAG: hypothetical protein WCG21_04315, partial [Eubacteriales bacterium]